MISYAGYKTSEGVAPELLSQFPILEEALQAMGVVVWPMVYFEADDALASAAAKAAENKDVGQVLICTPENASASAWWVHALSKLTARVSQCAMKPAWWPGSA